MTDVLGQNYGSKSVTRLENFKDSAIKTAKHFIKLIYGLHLFFVFELNYFNYTFQNADLSTEDIWCHKLKKG